MTAQTKQRETPRDLVMRALVQMTEASLISHAERPCAHRTALPSSHRGVIVAILCAPSPLRTMSAHMGGHSPPVGRGLAQPAHVTCLSRERRRHRRGPRCSLASSRRCQPTGTARRAHVASGDSFEKSAAAAAAAAAVAWPLPPERSRRVRAAHPSAYHGAAPGGTPARPG